MTPYQIKRSVLYAAIQGKITCQDPCEGTGLDLLLTNGIERKKLSLIHGLKKGKESKPFGESDLLFDIPQNWAWERFGNLVLNFDSRRKPVTKEDRKTTQGLYDYYGATGAIDKVDEYIFDGEYLMIGEDGGNFFVDRDNSFVASGKFWANNHVHVVQPVVCNIWYLKHCLDAYNLPNMGLINGIAVPKLNQENLNAIMIPIPPLAEQKRIVAKLEEILPLIDRYEAAWNKLEEFNKRFPGDMQKSILQLAIQGKLVEQRPEEGTGEKLFQQIQAEKQALIKAGRIKKEKPLPEITEAEIPFDIPESWRWVRLSQLVSVLNGDRGKNYPAKSTLSHKGIPFISALNLDGRSVVEDDNLLCLSEQQYEKLGNGKLIRDDIVVCIRGSLGKHGRYPFNKGAIASSLVILRAFTNDDILAEFLMMYLDTPLFFSEIRRYDNGTAQPNLAAKSLEQFLVPLPPLAEQKRIVAKLEEILPLCERLK